MVERLSDVEMLARNIEEARRLGRAQDVAGIERKGASRELAEYLLSLEARLNRLEAQQRIAATG